MEDREVQGVEAPSGDTGVVETTQETQTPVEQDENLLKIEPQEGEKVTDNSEVPEQDEPTPLSYEDYSEIGISEEEFNGIQEKYGSAATVQEALKMFFEDMKNAPKEEVPQEEKSLQNEMGKVPEDLKSKIPQIKAWAESLDKNEKALMAHLAKTAEGLAQVEAYRQAKLSSIPKGGGNNNNRVPSGVKPLGKDWLMTQQKNDLFYADSKEGEAFRGKLNKQIAENGDGNYFPEGYQIKL